MGSLMSNESRLSLTIDSRGAKANADELAKAMALLDSAGIRLQTSTQGVSKSIDGVESSSAAATATMRRFFLAATAGLSVKGLIGMVDQYGQMADRIGMATTSSEEYELVQRRLLATANATYRPLQEAQELYIRTADSIRALGFNTSQTLDITDSFSFLLVTNAASADRATSALNAYSKAIQTGKVNSESWQSILAAMPSISKTLADALGMTTTEVQKLGIEGGLSLADLNRGLLETVDVNKQLAASMGTTVNDAATRFKNNLTALLGEKNRANGATAALASGIDVFSNNLELLANVAGGAAAAGMAFYTLKTLGAAKASVTSFLASANLAKAHEQEAISANKAAQFASALAAADLTRARSAVTSAEAQVGADRAAQASNLQRLRNMQELMAVENALEVRRIKAQISDIGRQQAATRMAEIRLAEVAIAKQVEVAERSLAATTIATSAVVQKAYADRSAAAGVYAGAAKAAAATAATAERASAAANVFTRAGGALLGVLGGPAGLAITAGIAVTSLLAFSGGADEAASSAGGLTKEIDALNTSTKELTKNQASQAILNLEEPLSSAQSKVKLLEDNIEGLVLEMKRIPPGAPLFQEFQNALTRARGDLDTASGAVGRLVSRINDLKVVAGGAGESVASVAAGLSDEYTKLEARLNRQIALMGETGQAAQYRYDLEHGELSKLSDAEKILARAKVDKLAAEEKALDAKRKGTKATADEAKAIDSILKALREQVAVLGMTEQQAARHRIETAKGTDTQKKAALAMLDQVQASERVTKAKESYKSLLLDLRTDEQKATDLIKEQKKALDEAGVSAEQYAQVMARISEVGIGKAPKFGGIDAAVGGASGELIRVAEAQAELEKWRTEQLERQKSYLDQMEGYERQYADNVLNISRQFNEQQANLQASWRAASLANFSSVTGDAAEMMRALGHEGSAAYKVMFLASKAASIAQAWINTELAATRALAEMGPVAGPPMAGLVRSLGYASIGIMSATALTGMAHNGIDAVPREGTWLLDKGERVLSAKQNSDLTSYLKGSAATGPAGRGDITIQVVVNAETGDVGVSGADDQQMRQLGTMIAASARKVIIEEMRPYGLLDRNR